MKAKLLGAVSAAVLLCSVGIANAQGPMQLTEAQLDGITAGQDFAAVAATVVGGHATGSFFVAAATDFAVANISADFTGLLILNAVAVAR